MRNYLVLTANYTSNPSGFRRIDLEAQLHEDIAIASNADDRQRITNNEIPNAKELNFRLTRWEMIDSRRFAIIKKRPKWMLWLLGVIVGLWYFFK